MTGRRMIIGILFLFIGLATGAGAGAALWYAAPSAAGIPGEPTAFQGTPLTAAPAPVPGAPAPDFSLSDMEGGTIRLSELRGTPVAVAFWATWCEPCKTELPLLDEAAGSVGLRVLAIESAELEEDIRAFLEEIPLRSVTILSDSDGKIREEYFILGYPTTFFLDSDGIIRNKKVGTFDSSELESILKDLGGKP